MTRQFIIPKVVERVQDALAEESRKVQDRAAQLRAQEHERTTARVVESLRVRP
jgi:hypothetical protein